MDLGVEGFREVDLEVEGFWEPDRAGAPAPACLGAGLALPWDTALATRLRGARGLVPALPLAAGAVLVERRRGR